ncbi:hypothetical protein BCAR13_1840031 [Paraburkholderia caribensis]|nr:hypothetical protein BCAR13_1840031 [Paraburkholderia caribensis]
MCTSYEANPNDAWDVFSFPFQTLIAKMTSTRTITRRFCARWPRR